MRLATPFFGLIIGLLCWLLLVWLFAEPLFCRWAEWYGTNSVPKALIPPGMDESTLRKAKALREKWRQDGSLTEPTATDSSRSRRGP